MQIRFETRNGTVTVDCASTTARDDVLRLIVVMHKLVERDFDTLARDSEDDWDD